MIPTNSISTSIFDLFKVGPGPSSSHTIGPMKAAKDFLSRIRTLKNISNFAKIEITLYGSLAATGKGHGTDRAILAGLLNKSPEECEPEWFSNLFSKIDEKYFIEIDSQKINFSLSNIHFEKGRFDFPHPNTLIMQFSDESKLYLQEEYYSIGGGFIIRKGETKSDNDKNIPHPYSTMNELKDEIKKSNLTLPELIVENEIAISNHTREEIYFKIENIINFMISAVDRGLVAEGVLPGSIQLHRKAKSLFQKAKSQTSEHDSFLVYLNAYCEAASEENAAGNIVVTAPTSGASGVIPGIIYFLKIHQKISNQKLIDAMLVAATMGFLVKHNASISGAEMGCMGEIGTASAMAASMLAFCANQSVEVIESAAEIAIEHHLGMTCDPIGGYVQIPCIERNAMGAVKAYNAYLLASSGNQSFQKISLDNVIKVMKATGEEMSRKYKETSEAGLAGLSLGATEC